MPWPDGRGEIEMWRSAQKLAIFLQHAADRRGSGRSPVLASTVDRMLSPWHMCVSEVPFATLQGGDPTKVEDDLECTRRNLSCRS
jgi:hypothetical protein